MTIQIRYCDSVNEIDDNLWSVMGEAGFTPFNMKSYWQALESTGVVSAQTGWLAQHLVLEVDGQQWAWMPLFVKTHHRGEYVFDQGWAQAYEQHGLNYYPRLVTSIPFTPVVGGRVGFGRTQFIDSLSVLSMDGAIGSVALGQSALDALKDDAPIHKEHILPILLQAIQSLAEQLNASSWHGLFVDDVFRQMAQPLIRSGGMVERINCQFLWSNRAYADFDAFLDTFTAKRRKNTKAERRKVAQMGITCQFIEGEDISDDLWQFFYQCYERTYHVRGQQPYLTLAFFQTIGQTMKDCLVLEIASHPEHGLLAAALFFKDSTTLYGRYWGALYDIDCLHFEVCYYQGIEYAIKHGLRFFDPGTQGEHKLVRGFEPVYTHSLHWLSDPRFMMAVQEFTQRERISVEQYYEEALSALPFKQTESYF